MTYRRKVNAQLPKRCGVTKTKGVAEKTSLLVVRLRYHLKVQRRGGSDDPLLAEEVQTLAFTGAPNEPQWLDDVVVTPLLELNPSGNLPLSLVKQQLQHLIGHLDDLRTKLDDIATVRAKVLKDAHTRIRHSARMTGRIQVKPVDEVDILGCFILLPDAN